MNNSSPYSPRGMHHFAPSCRKTGSKYKGVSNDCKGAENIPSNRGETLRRCLKPATSISFSSL